MPAGGFHLRNEAREVKLGRSGLLERLRDEQLRLAWLGKLPIATFVAAFLGVCGLLDIFHVGSGAAELAVSVAFFVVGYFLMATLMRRAGNFDEVQREAFVTYCLIALAYGAAVFIGLFCFILPGLYLMMRWLAAFPDALVSGDIGRSLGRSWNLTKQHQMPLSIALSGPFLAYAFGFGVLMVPDIHTTPTILIYNFAFGLSLAWTILLEVAVFGVHDGG